MRNTSARRGQRGFLIIAAVFLLVVLAGLVAYLMTASTTSQAASAADANSARAYQAARAGAEWAAYLILQTPGGAGTLKTDCEGGGPITRDLSFGSTLSSFAATVTCSSVELPEGAGMVRSYTIVSNACNRTPTCPVASSDSTYVEREISIRITNN